MDAAYFLPKFMLKRLILKCLWRSFTMNWETENPGSWAAHMKFILKRAEDFFLLRFNLCDFVHFRYIFIKK